MPHNPIPGQDEHQQANPNSGIQNTVHKGHQSGSHQDSTGEQDLNGAGSQRNGTTADPSSAFASTSAASASGHDAGEGARVKGNTWVRPSDSEPPRAAQGSSSWYDDDRIGLVVAGIVIVGVLVAAWAVHRND